MTTHTPRFHRAIRERIRRSLPLLAAVLIAFTASAAHAARTANGLIVLYDFQSTDGDVVKDRSGVGQPLDLKIGDAKDVRRSKGALEITGDTIIRSDGAATKIIDAIKQSNELTIEAWVTPANDNQSGPARIVSLSRNSSERNFTLGQDGNKFDARLRSTATSDNGIPSVSSAGGTAKRERTHVMYVRSSTGNVRIYINGQQRGGGDIIGFTRNWNDDFRFALANELSGDRPWRGTYHLVAVFNKALSAQQAKAHFEAGADAKQTSPAVQVARSRDGLQMLYDFADASSSEVKDRSGVGKPYDLRIDRPNAVARGGGALEVRGDTVITGDGPADKLIDAVRKSHELTIEAWIQPDNTNQEGPARIVTLSKDTSERNFTLGQEGNQYDARLRTTERDKNGMPSISTPGGSVETKLTHVVYTRARSARAQLFINGEQRAARDVIGDMSNWDRSYRLALANELSGGRPWRGTMRMVAVYSRALSPKEVEQNYQAGSGAGAALVGNVTMRSPAELAKAEHHFEEHIAPLFARRCIECHSAKKPKGKLDLTSKTGAFAVRKDGPVIKPGDAEKSALYGVLIFDEMPEKGPPLTDREKKLIQEWIDDGAIWPDKATDLAAYAPSRDAAWIRRLTVAEYIETVKRAVGVDIGDQARKHLPPDLRADGFSNTAYNLTIDLGHVEAYAELARVIVSRMDAAKFASQYAPKKSLDDANVRRLIASMGKWLLRGPLNDREVASFLGIARVVEKEGGDYDEAVSYILEAMLQSPRFIYRMEDQRGDGDAQQLRPYELASRLSYILWGGPPDAALMQAADSGDLTKDDALAAQVRRMLADPRAVEHSQRFAYDWLDLGRLDHLSPNAKRFPGWSAELAADMRAETLAFFNEVAWKEKRPLTDLFNAQVTYLTPRLAKHYGLKPSDGTGDRVARYDLSKVTSRGGLLTQGSILTIGGDQASMVTRGLFVLHDVLRGHVDDPPPGLDTTPVPSSPGQSQRVIAEKRIANPSCGGCHVAFEPLAFGLEKYDGVGAYHEQDRHGNTLRDDGEVLFPGREQPVKYDNANQLMDLLAGSDRVSETLTWKLTQWALGRPLKEEDEPQLKAIHETAKKNGGTYQATMAAIVMSDLVRKTRTEKER